MRLIVFLSGGGSTLANLAEQEDMEIVLAISQNSKAISIINEKKIPLLITSDYKFIFDIIRLVEYDLVVLAGYSKLIPVPEDFKNRILNIHPSLLPKFGGKGMYDLKVHQAVLDSGELFSGCTVHLVNEQYDSGAILAQSRVPIALDETAESLQQKIKMAERALYPQAIREYWGKIK